MALPKDFKAHDFHIPVTLEDGAELARIYYDEICKLRTEKQKIEHQQEQDKANAKKIISEMIIDFKSFQIALDMAISGQTHVVKNSICETSKRLMNDKVVRLKAFMDSFMKGEEIYDYHNYF